MVFSIQGHTLTSTGPGAQERSGLAVSPASQRQRQLPEEGHPSYEWTRKNCVSSTSLSLVVCSNRALGGHPATPSVISPAISCPGQCCPYTTNNLNACHSASHSTTLGPYHSRHLSHFLFWPSLSCNLGNKMEGHYVSYRASSQMTPPFLLIMALTQTCRLEPFLCVEFLLGKFPCL